MPGPSFLSASFINYFAFVSSSSRRRAAVSRGLTSGKYANGISVKYAYSAARAHEGLPGSAREMTNMAETGNVLLDAVEKTAHATPDAPVFAVSGAPAVTYGELWNSTCQLACVLDREVPGMEPLLVLGAKSALTVEAFLACLMSGHAYVPVDAELPAQRVADIAGQIENPILLLTSVVPPQLDAALPDARALDARSLLARCQDTLAAASAPLPRSLWVTGEQTQYIIFTSGSTGRPKGIEVTEANVAGFRRWLATFPLVRDGGRVFLDQAHYSFELSEYELVGALTTGGCLHAVTAAPGDFRSLLADLASSGIEVWVSTPSFADLCLADPSFGEKLLPHLGLFLFCGEPLHHTTVQKLRRRFPAAIVANTYGPTESTVAVTYCQIADEELADPESLPVGIPRPGTELRFVDHKTGLPVPKGQAGEIIIVGDTVVRGYYRNPQKTAEAFFKAVMADGTPARGYRTGDLGHLDARGRLRCEGRLDSLVKLNGFRIELSEVEGALEAVPYVREAVVVPATRHGRVASLAAFVTVDRASAAAPAAAPVGVATPPAAPAPADDFALARALKAELARTLPAYMVPRQVRILAKMPLNANGKADRRALAAQVCRP